MLSIVQFSFSPICVAFFSAVTALKMSKTNALFTMNVETNWLAENYLHFCCSHLQSYSYAIYGFCSSNKTCGYKACGSKVDFDNCIVAHFSKTIICWLSFCSMLSNFELVTSKIYCIIVLIAFMMTVWDSNTMVLKNLIKSLNNCLS